MKILLVGGGSGGPVIPLLAVAQEIKKTHSQAEFLLVGSKKGPERAMAEKGGLSFLPINAGKLRRYFSFKNIAAPFFTAVGFFQSFKILKEFQPDCVFGAGSFVQVPLVWAAWLLKIPVVLHQQDILPSLANRACQLCAQKITVSFEANLKSFSSGLGLFYQKREDKIQFTGNPFRSELKEGSKPRGRQFFNLKTDMPTLLVLGGGTGAEYLNKLILTALPSLSKSFQIIHSTGSGKLKQAQFENYHAYEFIDNMADAYAVADIVLARAGLSTITELSNLKKLSIIVPMPGTHQEANAAFLVHAQAAIVLSQNKIKAEPFVNLLRKLLFATEAQEVLRQGMANVMPRNAAAKIAGIIVKVAERT